MEAIESLRGNIKNKQLTFKNCFLSLNNVIYL